MSKKTIVIICCVVGILLAIPLIAMNVTSEVNWSLADFGIAAVILFSSIYGVLSIYKSNKQKSYKVFLSILIVLSTILLWMELAVGIF